jgi:hypothetical protein
MMTFLGHLIRKKKIDETTITTLPDDLMFLLQCIFSSLDLAPARSNIFPAYPFQEVRKNLFFRFGYS